MKFAVHCIDHEGKVADRVAYYEAHKSYLSQGPVATVISGPLLAEDNETMIGSLFVFEAEDLETVRRYNAADPFNKAGIWKTISIHPFLLRVDNRS
ncbi:YciI family protein [Sinirhodobacter populi]|uniref:YciI family protein n=1 Tax=Paenirhodobacter populi TaxID=2306993 RepID=A0A443KNX5_9RHOB|nr:YciI family protein [Sinirhodobacter populi]RWR34573.1 YciI family protein [Sinirhodobacter populi]